jgi:hypothetical protein
MRRWTLSALVAALVLALAPAAAAQTDGGQVTVIHGIPGLTVDVFVNGDETVPDFEPGDVAGPLDLPAGDYDLAIAPAGEGIDAAVLTGMATVTDGLNASIIAHLTEAGDPTISIFVNDTSEIAGGESRLVVRHTAAAPTVDILLADGTELFTGVSNPQEGQVDVPAGSYDVEIAPAGAGVDGSVFSAPGVELAEGTARIVYATGDLAGGSFSLVIQDIAGLHTAPDSVDTGGAPASAPTAWLVALMALVLVGGAAVATPLVARRTR